MGRDLRLRLPALAASPTGVTSMPTPSMMGWVPPSKPEHAPPLPKAYLVVPMQAGCVEDVIMGFFNSANALAMRSCTYAATVLGPRRAVGHGWAAGLRA
jgi:hypothetical protein